MIVFAIGGTTFGMAEESLAFYVLIITVMIAAGYDALVGAAIMLLGCGIGVLGSTINPFATASRPASPGRRSARVSSAAGDPGRRHRHRHLVGDALCRAGQKDPSKSLVYAMKADNEAHFNAAATDGEARR